MHSSGQETREPQLVHQSNVKISNYFLHLCPISIQAGIPIEKRICCVIDGWSIKEAFQAINVHSFSYGASFHTVEPL